MRESESPGPFGPEPDREEAAAAVRRAVGRLDRAMDALAEVRPRQVHAWRKRSRAMFLKLAEPGGFEGRQLTALLADLRALLQQARAVAEEELGMAEVDW